VIVSRRMGLGRGREELVAAYVEEINTNFGDKAENRQISQSTINFDVKI
jgi:hypothetical protein